MLPLSLDGSDLASRVRAKDPEVLRAIVHEYLPQVIRAARGAGLNVDEAEDIAQSVFVAFFEKATEFEGRSHVRTFLFGILLNKISEARRLIAKERRMDDIDDVFESRFAANGHWSTPPKTADANLLAEEVRKDIEDCLDQAPERQRLAFVLREVEEIPTEEICKILDVSVTNLGVMMFRVRNHLRECLESKGVWGD